MKRRRLFDRIAAGVLTAGVAFLIVGATAWALGARVNTTQSIPLGLYWTSAAPLERGAYVIFCPPKIGVFEQALARGYLGAGYCPGGYGYLMKRVLAVNNDTVSVADDGVRVNEALLPLSTPLVADGAGRPMPRYRAARHALRDGELLLMSDRTAVSFDGRYFGPVHRSQVVTVIRPVITW